MGGQPGGTGRLARGQEADERFNRESARSIALKAELDERVGWIGEQFGDEEKKVERLKKKSDGSVGLE